ncbi:MAG TPA: class I SAM-dependent methyltransferase [Alphaproteobacteria bacterium]|nr:class I SAM-dependent methyltransferase [Alphaproteobacteria bacterium]
MEASADFEKLNETKANFDAIYTEPDPRAYFRVLGGLDYTIPELAAPVFRQLVTARQAQQDRPVTVLDLGCSYGINAALLRFSLSLDMLRRRYMHPDIQALSAGSMRAYDAAYFASWPARYGLSIVGLDASASAVQYAQQVGILNAGLVEDLERDQPSERARSFLADVDLVISTGCVGYVTQKTFAKILACNQNSTPPWIASFVLRMFPYDGITKAIKSFGLETEKFAGATFVQRRFHSAEEYDLTLSSLESLGIDPAGREAEGLLHAELFVSRPAARIREKPLGGLISIVSGQNRRYGRRFYRVRGKGRRELLVN